MSFFHELEASLAETMQADRHRLRNRLRGVRRLEEQGREFDGQLAEFQRDLAAATAKWKARAAAVPKVTYDLELPVVRRREEIAAAIRDNQVVVLCGETGSGKSTQLPKICVELGRGVSGLIGHTQPRRIAARSVAARLAEELNSPLGSAVGFKIRFADQTSPNTLIKVMTDGVLLAETQSDRFLDQYDTLIIDEAHERSLNIDFLLGYLHRLLPRRPDLKLIITSATIDATRFAAHFGKIIDERVSPPITVPAPILEVQGRTYPVDVLYRPPLADPETGDVDLLRGVVHAVEEISTLGPGNILVFLPTERDILEVHQKLRGWERSSGGGGIEIVPLYARLSTAEQNRVFQPSRGRRIVLATNVAESSLTVPGIHYVIDTGTARISRYSPRSQVQRLPIEAVSQASADQRKGRCGRIGPGVCIRLYSEEDFLGRERFTPPEIQRTNLAAVILQTLAFGLGPIDEFPFLDPPRLESIRDGRKTLFEIGAIDDQQKLTPLGGKLARLPVDPRIGRMLVAAADEGCLADVLIIAAALETQDPRDRPMAHQQAADQAHAQFADGDSDFISYLRLWDFYHRLKESLSRNQLQRAAKQNFLSDVRMREWQDVHRQLLEMIGQSGLKAGKRKLGPFHEREAAIVPDANEPDAAESSAHHPTDYASVHRALLTGLLSNIALRGDANEYTAGGNQKLILWPGSGIYGRKPKWIVAAELIETTRRYARIAARIDPEWLEPLAPHLVKRTYSEPHWDARGGCTNAFERVTLFGLTIIPKRRIRYSAVDPKVAREFFLRQGLVAGEMQTRGPFFVQNQKLLEELGRLSAKTRQRDLIVDEERIYDFYAARVPVEITDVPSFEKWRKAAEQKQPQLLHMKQEDVLPVAEDVAPATHFPDQLEFGRTRLNLQYRFEPGDSEDGVTVTVPPAGLGQLAQDRLDWLVPGLVQEKVEALIRSLPKTLRRNLIPAPDVAKRIARDLRFGEGNFLSAAADALSQVAGESISPDAFDPARLPPHLQLNVRVVDEKGKLLKESRDLAELREHFQVQAVAAPPIASPWHRDGLLSWDFDLLPTEIEIPAKPHRIVKHVAIIDQGETASLRLLDTVDEAQRQSHAGMRRLIVLAEKRELKAQVEWLPNFNQLAVYAAPFCKERPLKDQAIDLLADRAWRALDFRRPKSKVEFELLRKDIRREITPAVQSLSKLLGPLCEAFHQLRLALGEKRPVTWESSLADLRRQSAELTPPGFLTSTPANWLDHYPRYLRGMTQRLTKLAGGGLARDRQQATVVEPLDQRRRERQEQHLRRGVNDPELTLYRWMLEELRISLFAQELGTSLPVSPQRLEKQWAKVRS